MSSNDPPVPARRTRPRDRKASIMQAATKAFAADGYHRTSMADIASALGISSTALYRHFRNKEDLLGRTLLAGLDATLARLEQSGTDILAELTQTALDHRELPSLWQREVRNLSPIDRRAVLMRVVRLNRQLRRAVAEQRPDLAPADVEFLAWCALSVAVSPSHHNVALPRARFAEYLDVMISQIVQAPISPSDLRGADERKPRVPDPAPRPEQLLVVAARLFNSRGYGAVGIEDIGAAAGISGPSIYHHFAGKSELLTEIVERSDQWIQLCTARALVVGRTPEESLELILRSWAQFAAEQPDLIGTTVSETIHLPTEYAARTRKAHRDGVIRWSKMLQTARPDLELDVARVHVQAVTTMVNDAVRNARLMHRRDLVDTLVALGTRALTLPEAEIRSA